MTAFGQAVLESDSAQLRCEIRTLNTRYLEINLKIPKPYMELESEIQKRIKGKIHRGKLDVVFDIARSEPVRSLPQLDLEAVRHYGKLIDEMRLEVDDCCQSLKGQSVTFGVADWLSLEGVIKDSPSRANNEICDSDRDHILSVLEASLEKVLDGRKKEGALLVDAIRGYLGQFSANLEELVKIKKALATEIQSNYLEKLNETIERLQTTNGAVKMQPSEERIAMEVAVIADKMDVSEEIDRLQAHKSAFFTLLSVDEPIGRKLDFYCQELLREVNTISSKMQHKLVSVHVIEMKHLIEKIRQQVQNIE